MSGLRIHCIDYVQQQQPGGIVPDRLVYIEYIYIYNLEISFIYQMCIYQASLTLPQSPPVFQAGLGPFRMLQRQRPFKPGLWHRAQLRFGGLMATS